MGMHQLKGEFMASIWWCLTWSSQALLRVCAHTFWFIYNSYLLIFSSGPVEIVACIALWFMTLYSQDYKGIRKMKNCWSSMDLMASIGVRVRRGDRMELVCGSILEVVGTVLWVSLDTMLGMVLNWGFGMICGRGRPSSRKGFPICVC